jgi:hypothetical protein
VFDFHGDAVSVKHPLSVLQAGIDYYYASFQGPLSFSAFFKLLVVAKMSTSTPKFGTL